MLNLTVSNFKHVETATLTFLFNAYYKPECSITLWNNVSTFRSTVFRTFGTAYTKAFKKILGVPQFANSHASAQICNQLLLCSGCSPM